MPPRRSAESTTKPKPKRAKKNPNRPPTLKEARKAYLARGGSAYVAPEERARLIRAQEREEARVAQVKREAAQRTKSQAAAKKRAEDAARRRDEQRKLGIPDPAIKIAEGQLRIGAFLKGRKAEDEEEGRDGVDIPAEGEDGLEEGNSEEEEAGDTERKRSDPQEKTEGGEDGAGDIKYEEEDFGSDFAEDDALAADVALERLAQLPATPQKPASLTADLLRSSFFESNTQLEREMNDEVPTSPILQPLIEEARPQHHIRPVLTPRAVVSERTTPRPVIKTPERSEIENILFAISSQELEFLPSSPPAKIQRMT